VKATIVTDDFRGFIQPEQANITEMLENRQHLLPLDLAEQSFVNLFHSQDKSEYW
jgi:hypothetical protein